MPARAMSAPGIEPPRSSVAPSRRHRPVCAARAGHPALCVSLAVPRIPLCQKRFPIRSALSALSQLAVRARCARFQLLQADQQLRQVFTWVTRELRPRSRKRVAHAFGQCRITVRDGAPEGSRQRRDLAQLVRHPYGGGEGGGARPLPQVGGGDVRETLLGISTSARVGGSLARCLEDMPCIRSGERRHDVGYRVNTTPGRLVPMVIGTYRNFFRRKSHRRRAPVAPRWVGPA